MGSILAPGGVHPLEGVGEAGLVPRAGGCQGRGWFSHCLEQSGAQSKGVCPAEAQLMLPGRPQVPWKICKAQTWNFMLKQDLAVLNLDELNLCPAFVLCPEPAPVLTAVRPRHSDLSG